MIYLFKMVHKHYDKLSSTEIKFYSVQMTHVLAL